VSRQIRPIPTVLNNEDGRWDPGDPEWEMRFWPRIMFLDAGTVSGLSVLWFDPVRLQNPKIPSARAILAWWSSYVAGAENDQADAILGLAQYLVGTEGFCFGAEKFIVQKVQKGDEFLSSPRIASKVDYGMHRGLPVRDAEGVLHRRRIATVWQNPADIDKSARGENMLKVMQMWLPGPDHRNDATKHAILLMRRMRDAPLGQFEKLFGNHPDWASA
jgi:hypothetical protein